MIKKNTIFVSKNTYLLFLKLYSIFMLKNTNLSNEAIDRQSLLSDSLKIKVLDQLSNSFPGEQDKEKIKSIASSITKEAINATANTVLEEKMEILYKYEKHYLDILKEFKDEIKFAASLQEDIRKERAKFFAETLKEVSATLKTTEVDKSVISEWTKDLVKSYTKSLDASSLLATEQVQEILSTIQNDGKETINQITDK